MRLRPLGHDVLIHPIDNPEMSQSGSLHLPEREKRKVINQGIVIAKGPDVKEDIEIADHVYFNGYTGDEIPAPTGDQIALAKGGFFYVIPEEFIIAAKTTSTVVLIDTVMMKRIIQGRMGEIKLKNEGNPDPSLFQFLDELEEDLLHRIDTVTFAEGFEF